MTDAVRRIMALLCVGLLALSARQGSAQSPDLLRLSVATAPVDLGFLNERPAGLRGHVRAEGADLVFEDGTPVRFWGANVQAYAIFSTEPAEICRHAKRLGALGFNLVRLHHHDSHWVNPNIFGQKAPDTLSLDPAALARIGRWVACLKAEGLYTWLDLHVGRRMSAADDIPFADEVERNGGDARGFNFVNDGIRDRMAEFQAAYLSYVNPYTGLALKDDPAVAFVLISNENDATYHFGNRLLPDKNVPLHSALFMARAGEFAVAHGLNPNEVWRSWEHGASKIFLNDLERRFFAPLAEDIRDQGFGGIIATSSLWGGMGLAGLPSLTVGDIIDVHSYGASGLARTDPATEDDMISVIAGAQVAGMPLSVSEWNVSPWPEPDRFLGPLRMGAAAAHQGWDAPIIYGYAQNALGRTGAASNWHIAEDASLLGALSVAALLYRRGDVAGAERVIAVAPDAETILGAHWQADTSRAIRTLAERSRLINSLPEIPELPWLLPPAEHADTTLPSYDTALPDADERPIVSDTGQIGRDPEAGLFWVDTDRSVVIAGALAGEPREVGGLRVALDRPLAGVALQSLDGAPIAQSDDLLVTIMGPSSPVTSGRPPFMVERATGEITFDAKPGLVAEGSALGDGSGRVMHRVDGATHHLSLNGAPGIAWIRLRAP